MPDRLLESGSRHGEGQVELVPDAFKISSYLLDGVVHDPVGIGFASPTIYKVQRGDGRGGTPDLDQTDGGFQVAKVTFDQWSTGNDNNHPSYQFLSPRPAGLKLEPHWDSGLDACRAGEYLIDL